MLNKTKEYWVGNFDLTTICVGFNNQHMQNIGIPFLGKVNLLLFERQKVKIFEKAIKFKYFLHGWLGDKNNKKTEYDFIISVDNIMPFDYINKQIEYYDLSYESVILQMEFIKNRINNTDVILTKFK